MSEANQKNPHTKFIALSGKKQVGKDTAARMINEIICDTNPFAKIVVTSFAGPLKEMCIEILGLSKEGVYGTDAQKNSLSHIIWDGFPLEVRLKYSNEFTSYEYGSFIDVPEKRSQALPRSGPMSNREVLQVIGTDIFRVIYGDVWARAPFNKDWENADVVILTDCRFPNEKWVTEEHGGVIIRLERDTGFTDNHPSEVALDDFHFENRYDNNGSFFELGKYLKEVLCSHKII